MLHQATRRLNAVMAGASRVNSGYHSSIKNKFKFSKASLYLFQNAAFSTNQTKMTFEHNFIGHLAASSVLCRQGGTVVHAVVAVNSRVTPESDNLPLTVDYRDRAYAHGNLPKTMNKRERHGADEEILVARIIDRAVRPLFPPGFLDEVQITVTAHAVDGISDPIVLAVNAVSCALMSANIPWNGPLGCVRISSLTAGSFICNPTIEQINTSSLDLLYAGTEQRPLM